MGPSLLQRIMAMLLLISSLAVQGVSSIRLTSKNSETEDTKEPCPPCEILFSKLEKTGRDTKLSQNVQVQERGEPKSGTRILYCWATAALIRACDYLQEQFGEGSCTFDFIRKYKAHSIVFEPGLGGIESKCSCDMIERVSAVISTNNKHMLPVNDTCAFAHSGGTGVGEKQVEGYARDPPCTFADGTHVKNYDELWRCMHEADCDVTDEWTQMVIFRDPRTVVVSTFYFVEVHGEKDLGDLDAFVTRELPIVCQWLAVRYILFAGFLADRSTEFWYNDAMIDPVKWHYRWFHTVGMQLPFHVVEAIAQAATVDDLGFAHAGMDLHPGEEEKTEPGVRRFEDEVRPETFAIADDVLRTWLPPVLLERLGVLP